LAGLDPATQTSSRCAVWKSGSPAQGRWWRESGRGHNWAPDAL